MAAQGAEPDARCSPGLTGPFTVGWGAGGDTRGLKDEQPPLGTAFLPANSFAVHRREADPPHKRPTVAVELPCPLNSYFVCFGRGAGMGLFLVLLCCSAVVGGCGGLGIFPDNSRFGEFNSRLGGANSRFALLREFASKALIRLTVFADNRGCSWRIDEIPGCDGKNRESAPTADQSSASVIVLR